MRELRAKLLISEVGRIKTVISQVWITIESGCTESAQRWKFTNNLLETVRVAVIARLQLRSINSLHSHSVNYVRQTAPVDFHKNDNSWHFTPKCKQFFLISRTDKVLSFIRSYARVLSFFVCTLPHVFISTVYVQCTASDSCLMCDCARYKFSYYYYCFGCICHILIKVYLRLIRPFSCR